MTVTAATVSDCYHRMMGRSWWEENRQQLWQRGRHRQTCTGQPLLVIVWLESDSQHRQAGWNHRMRPARCENKADSAAAVMWKSLSAAHILYPISCVKSGWLLCYPLPLTHSPCNLLQQGGGRVIVYLHMGTYLLYVHHRSVCLLLPIEASGQYCRCSLSHNIVVARGWRSISWYHLIDIIPMV